MTTIKSNRKHGDSNLTAPYPPGRAEKLLQFWANLADPVAGNFRSYVTGLTRRFPEIFDELRGWQGTAVSEGSEPDEVNFFRSIWGLREHLRSVWRAHGVREREWYIHEMRRLHVLHSRALSNPYLPLLQTDLAGVGAFDRLNVEQPVGSNVPRTDNKAIANDIQQRIDAFRNSVHSWVYVIEPPPSLTLFETVMFHFQRIADQARQCGNPECPAPFFFVKNKGQEYCSPECALPAQRRSKRDWWIKNREQETKKRRQKRQAANESATYSKKPTKQGGGR